MELTLRQNQIHNVNDFFDFLNSQLLFNGNLPSDLQDKLTIHLDNLKNRNLNGTGKTSITDACNVAKEKLLVLKALVESTTTSNLQNDLQQSDKIFRQIVNAADDLLISLKSLNEPSFADILNRGAETALKHSNAPIIPSDTFSTVCKEFIDERMTGNNWEDKTRNSYTATFNLFKDLFGDVTVSTLKVGECRDFKSQVQLIPKNHSKVKDYRNKSIKELVELKVPQDKRISVASANKHMSRMSSLFNWCKQQGYIQENLFGGMQIRINKSKINNRDPFSMEDLNLLFSTPIYKSNSKIKHSYYFWLPLIGLYSGARIQEICQLELADIYEIDGTMIFDINANSPTKRLKTLNSKRRIPVHQDLITLGFDHFLTKRHKSKHTHLFPELNKNTSNRDGQSQTASKWFARYKEKLGFSLDGVKAFHSFRHTFVNELKHNNTPEHITAALTGHSHDSITYSVYGGENTVELLNGHLQKIKYEGFNKQHIKWHLK